MHFVYILQSESDKSYYIGETSIIRDRLKFHNLGKQRYTRARVPWKLVYVEEFENRHNALLREKEIKRKKSKKYLELIIANSNSGIAPTVVGTPGP